jgi:hypothetical protein
VIKKNKTALYKMFPIIFLYPSTELLQEDCDFKIKNAYTLPMTSLDSTIRVLRLFSICGDKKSCNISLWKIRNSSIIMKRISFYNRIYLKESYFCLTHSQCIINRSDKIKRKVCKVRDCFTFKKIVSRDWKGPLMVWLNRTEGSTY